MKLYIMREDVYERINEQDRKEVAMLVQLVLALIIIWLLVILVKLWFG